MAEPEAAPPVAATQTSTNATTTQATAPDADPGDGSLPSWVKDRIERSKRAVLRDIGASTLDEAKALKAERDALKEATKTVEQRESERKAELEKAAAERDELRKDLADYAEAQLAKLPEDERELIVDAAPRSPAKQLRLIEKYHAIQTKRAEEAAKKAAPATSAAAPAQRPAPASTTTANGAPQAATTSPVNHRAEYERLKATNQYAASKYLLIHQREITATANE